MNLYLVCISKEGETGETQRIFLSQENAIKWMEKAKEVYRINHDVDLTLVIDDIFDINEYDINIERK